MTWSERACVKSIQDAAEDLGKAPTVEEFKDFPGPTENTIKRVFGSWNDALLEAGLPVNQMNDGQIDPPDDFNASYTTMYRKGYRARLRGEDKCPYEEGSPGFDTWTLGWKDADEKLNRTMMEVIRSLGGRQVLVCPDCEAQTTALTGKVVWCTHER